MAVLIVMFLVTIIAHGVTPDLECWKCQAFENKDGKHFCNDPNNFKLVKCKKDETICIDMIEKDDKYLLKGCTSEKIWNEMTSIIGREKLNVILDTCDTMKCNAKRWKDYFPVIEPVTSHLDLECWECRGEEDENGKHPCDDSNNFKLKKCEKDEKLCVDMIDKEYKHMLKDCMTEKEWNEAKTYAEAAKLDVIMKKCDTTECNNKRWKDY